MKYVNNKIVYEVGDWMTICYSSPNATHQIKSIREYTIDEPSSLDEYPAGVGQEFSFVDRENFSTNSAVWNTVRPASQNEINIKSKFKVGDWVYAEKGHNNDCRNTMYIPLFQVKEVIPLNKGELYLRPEKDKVSGLKAVDCRLATDDEIAKVQTLTIAGHEVKFGKYVTAIGCVEKPNEDWNMLLLCMNKFSLRFVNHTSGDTVTYDKIRQLCERIKK